MMAFQVDKKKTKEKTGTDLKKQIDQHQHYLVAFTLGYRLFPSQTSVKNEKKDKSWQNRKRAGLWFSLLGSDMVTRHQIETRPNESSVNKRDVTKSKQTLRERWIPFFFEIPAWIRWNDWSHSPRVIGLSSSCLYPVESSRSCTLRYRLTHVNEFLPMNFVNYWTF